MLTGRSIKPGAGSISKKQLCHSGESQKLGQVKGAVFWHNVSITPHQHWHIYVSQYHESEGQALKWWECPHSCTQSCQGIDGHRCTPPCEVHRQTITPNELHSKFSEKHKLSTDCTHTHAYCKANRERPRLILWYNIKSHPKSQCVLAFALVLSLSLLLKHTHTHTQNHIKKTYRFIPIGSHISHT